MKNNTYIKIIENKADEMLEKAEKNDTINGLINLLPAGGFLERYLFKRTRENADKRVEEFHEKLQVEIESINESKIDKEYFDSEEFNSIVIKIFARYIWEHSEEKRQYLRNILLNSVTYDFSKNPLKETIIENIDSLSPIHIKVLEAYSNGKLRGTQGWNSSEELPEVIEGLSKLNGEAIIFDLNNKGLLRSEEHHTFEINALGESILRFIKK